MKDSVDSRNLFVIPTNEWPILRDLFKENWPKNIISYYSLQNYIRWLEKNPAMDDVAIYSIDSDWRTHGTFILEDRNEKHYSVLFHTLYERNHHLMLAALQRLERKPAYMLTAYSKQVEPAVHHHLHQLGISNIVKGLYPSVHYHLPREKCMQLVMRPPEGFIIKPLTLDNVETVNDLWPHRHPGSDYYIERLIKYNLTIGIFEPKTKELCAWVFQSELGAIGLLHVKQQYKRRGFGEYLVCHLARSLAEIGFDATAMALEINVPSRSLFVKLGFELLGSVFWYDKEAISNE